MTTFDPHAAVAFARRFGPPIVMAFRGGRCLHPAEPTVEAAEAFVAAHADDDLYFAVAATRDGLVGKPTKADCTGSDWAWADLDPPKGEADLAAWRAGRLAEIEASGIPEPQIVVCSGRGLWFFWKLTRRLSPAEAEEINLGLAQRLGADHCHNIDRVARLPHTRNSKTGEIATILADRKGVNDPGDLPRAAASASSRAAEVDIGEAVRVNDLGELDRWGVSPRVKIIIAQGQTPDEKKRGDDSRSAWLFDAVCNLVRAGVPDEVILGIVTDPGWAISASVFRRKDGERVPDPERYAVQQIRNAREDVAKVATELRRDQNGRPLSDQHNIRAALTLMGARVRHDVFQDRMLVEGIGGIGPLLNDASMKRLWLETESRFGFRPSKEYFWDVVEDAARRDAFHPVRDYLDALTWDGRPRVDLWLSAYGGAEDSPYVRAVAALVLLAAVRRVRDPGCKFDEMPVLESDQGKNKSSALAALAVREEWFSDDLPLNADTQKTIERMSGRWIIEAAELKGMRKGDVEHLKAFLSRRVDRARLAYGRMTTEVPRQCVIVGTTNSDRYLRDATGNRRFWPVRVGTFDLEALRRDRDQLWAEAAAREAAGASTRLDPSLWGDAAEEQEARRVEDPFVVSFRRVLGDMTGKLKVEDAWAILDMPPGQQTQDHNARLGEAMRELGWERTKLRFGGRPDWAYARGAAYERSRQIVVRRSDRGEIVASYAEPRRGDEGGPAEQVEVPF